MRKVLIISSSIKLQLSLRLSLIYNGDQVHTCSSLEASHRMLEKYDFDAIILHIHKYVENSFAYIKLLRRHSQFTPVLFVGHHANQYAMQSACSGLEDYMTLPVNYNQLNRKLDHVQNLPEVKENIEKIPLINLNELEGKLTVQQKTIKLTKVEMKILMLLSNKAGSVVSLQKIYALIEQEGARFNNRVFVHVSNLRKKIEHAGIQCLNISFAKDGYRLDILY